MQSLRFVGRHNVVHRYQRLLLYSTTTTTTTTTATTTTSSSSTSTHHCFADYLVDTLGFSHQQALSVSTKLSKRKKVNDSHFLDNATSVVNLFKIHGFDETHLRKIVSKEPGLLNSNAESTLIPKFNFFKEQGFSGSDLIRVNSKNPSILRYGVDSSILPAFRILRQVMGCHSYVITVFSKPRARYIFTSVKNLLPNVALLRSYGIPIELIRKHLLMKPGSYIHNPRVFKDVTMRVEDKLGITRDSMMFLYGIELICGFSEENLLSKCRIFKSFGWTQSEIQTFMTKNLSCFKLSEQHIQKKLDFLMNELQLKPAYLTSRTSFFTLSLEKRVVARHKLMLILKEKGLLNEKVSFYTAIKLSEPSFLKREVDTLISQDESDSWLLAGGKCIDQHDNATSVVNLFKTYGFDETHLRKIVSKEPGLLNSDAELTLIPKFNFFKEQGFSGSDIIRVISKNPTILKYGVDSSISPAFRILRQVMGCDDYVIRVLLNLGLRAVCTSVKNLLPNVALLRSYGIPIELIRKHLLRMPAHYMQNPQVFEDVTMRVEDKVGITRTSPVFLYGINLICGFSEESILSKCRIFESFGWTQSEIQTFMMKNANCFTHSNERIKKRLDFLMNDLQLEPAYLTSLFCFFTCSLEKRILPRHKILFILKEKGLLNKVPSLYGAIQLSEPHFLTRLVLPFQEVHEVYAKHTGCSLKMLSQGSVVISS
ncbi:hypothetical protein KSS87_013496 [Heliosperma pusillum]|nr:hypothetical protein KSS87_013496 [Heliosperma pusillum]